ncbi:MAG: GNAT family N-acetyltransferase [bacterium]|nr:GNAT family N-acetyltransferase [bacterium]
MKVTDLTPEFENLYFLCLEDWSDEIKEAGNHKETWYRKMKDRGLGVKLTLDDRGRVGGMIQYIPVEYSPAEGTDLYFINCIWVHGHKKGRGNFQKKGMGKALLQAAEEDVKALGAKGLAAWGLALPVWMKASWFKKHGYTQADRLGLTSLVWKSFTPEAAPPRWIRPRKKPGTMPGKVTVTSFLNGWCPAQNLASERAKKAASGFGDKVDFREINTFDRETFLEWGYSDALFIDEKQVRTGPPPSEEKIRKIIARKMKKLS